jgi:two-component system, cell cycle sensor histidine kinase and response regulator CckA
MVHIIPKDDPKQALRIKRFLMAVGTYIIWMLIALYCYYDGLFARMPWSIYWTFTFIITTNLFIFFSIRSGLNRRFRDPSLTMIQIALATVWTMLMAYCLDAGRGILLLLYMVVFTFGTFRLSFRQFCLLSIFALIGYGSVIILLLINYPKSVNLKVELLYLGTLFTVLIWFSFIGSHMNGLRKKLTTSLDELSNANNELQKVNDLIKQSKDRYRSILDNMEEAYYEVDLEGNLSFFNSTAVKNLGYSNEEMMGMNFRRFVDTENAHKVFEAYHKVFLTGDAIKGFDWEFINKYGKKMAVEASVSLQRDIQGNPIGFRGVVRDVSTRKQGEEALRKSEEKYRTILESIEEAYFELDLKGNYTFFNDFLCKINGYDRDELMGMNYRTYTTSESVQQAYKIYNEIYLTGKPRNQVSYEIVRKDGKKIVVEMSVALMRDPTGEPIGFRGVGRDVTSRNMAEQALKETAERYRTIFENTATANIIIGEDTTILLANSNFENMTGYSKHELEGKMSWAHFVVEEDLEKMKHYHRMRRVAPGSVPNSYEFRFTNRKGEVRDLFMNVAVIPGTRESIASIIDITESKNLEEQLTRAQKMEAIGTLAGGIAHDFNNLLMGILGNVSLIRMNFNETDPFFDRLKNVEEYVKRGSDLTKQLLGFARGGKYEVKPTDLGDFIHKSSEMFGRTRKEISIHYSIQDGLWPVEVDKGQMEQVLLNLYVNAWQAMPEGGDLYLSVENAELDEMSLSPYDIKPGEFVKVTVRDTGIGMDETTKAHIFEPFFTTKERGRGTGLGLASAYGIIKNHGGFISVESKTNRGTSFIIYLPASDKEVEDEYRPEDEVQKGNETVLLIDDEEMILDIGSKMLETLGYKVMTAAGGKLGVKIYEQNCGKIDLVILDMIMPGFSGAVTFESLRRIDPSVRVLLSSGYSIEGQAKEIMQDGCRGFIQKPFSMTELSRKIRRTLHKKSVGRDTLMRRDSDTTGPVSK